MDIKRAIENLRACGSIVGLNKVIEKWSDDELIIFALHFLSANIEDAIYISDEDENVSN